ncbi:MAG: 16S rRNA (adenine(1518)-N(6)/adenine(1519)-N(6))-dimethyltransferase RsmA [Candidatus Diapherotrites archaeon]|nr:16S rRNA (adenine(1518)-N(6)/adenine(1519)-N(6))-dimethyltransferase RsmA [Candidatus Diapherotrites archaeon]
MFLHTRLQGLMVKYRFKPDRRLSQNFCVSEHFLDKLVTAAKLKSSDTVLEIGAGAGFLTEKLLEKCRVIAIEKDDALKQLLETELPEQDLELRHEDFLDSQFKKGAFNKIVSLPPYSVSSEIVYKILTLEFEDAYLVFQKEFAEKLVSQPGFADFGAISVATQYYCDAQLLFTVESNVFFPKPPGFSACLHLHSRRRFGRVSDEALFVHLIKELFRYKNKSLENALELAYPFLSKKLGYSREKMESRIKELPFVSQKIYLMEVEEFVGLFSALHPSK